MSQNENTEKVEADLLAYCYVDPAIIDKAVQAGITPAHFTNPQRHHQFRFLCQLRLQQRPTDVAGVYQAAASDGVLEQLGGVQAIMWAGDLTHTTPGGGEPAMAALHALWSRRESYKLLGSAMADLEAGHDMAKVRATMEQAAGVLAGQQRVQRTLADIDNEIETNLHEIEAGTALTGAISWGIPKMDSYMKPIMKNEYVLICARPSRGKTSLLSHLAAYNLSHGKRVVYFNLEDADTEIIKKMAAQMAGICITDWATLDAAQRERFRIYKKKIVTSKNFMVFDKDNTLEAIQTRCRLLAAGFKPQLVLIDYLGCLRLPGKSIYESVSTVSKAMPPLRKLLDCPLVVGQQLKRSDDETREPGLQDLRDSGQLEEDAARVVMLHWKDPTKLDIDYRDYVILQPKHRFGPTTAVAGITFHAPTTRFMETKLN